MKAATLKKTQEQIAHSQMMIEYYLHRAEQEPNTKEKAKLELQADQLRAGMENNIAFMLWAAE